MADSGNLDQQVGRLIGLTEGFGRELGEIRGLLAKHVENNNERHEKAESRVSTLERHHDETKGGMRMLVFLGGIAGTIGGLASAFIGKLWPGG